MKITKDQAKQEVEVYGTLLQERAVISEIEKEEVRGEIQYSFTILDTKYPLPVQCVGIKQLALVLSAMWTSYLKAYEESGMSLDYLLL